MNEFSKTLAGWVADHPQPQGTTVGQLRHTLDVFADEPNDGFVVVATRNAYGDGVTTGITWGDLRILRECLDRYLSDLGVGG